MCTFETHEQLTLMNNEHTHVSASARVDIKACAKWCSAYHLKTMAALAVLEDIVNGAIGRERC